MHVLIVRGDWINYFHELAIKAGSSFTIYLVVVKILKSVDLL